MTKNGERRIPSLPGGIFAEELARIMALPPYERAVAAEELMDHARVFQAALFDARVEAVGELRAAGLTMAEVGELIGVTPGRVNQLLKRHGRRAAPLSFDDGSEKRIATPIEVRRLARAEAARAAAVLDEIGSHGPLGRPGKDAGGEWDWLRGLHAEERRRIRRWTREGGLAPDQVARMTAAALNLPEDDFERCILAWVDLTRRVDLGRSVATGRDPDPRRYGGQSARSMFGRNDEPAEEEPWVAELRAAQVGVSPASLTLEQWKAELAACRATLEADDADGDWSTPEGDLAWQRYRELLPLGLDVDGLAPEVIYRRVVAGYRLCVA